MHRALTAALLILVAAAGPAAAHSVSGAGPNNYRTVLTAVDDAPEGVSVRIVEAGSRIEVRNTSDVEVHVEGYSNEPYLRITADGVFINVHSPATYLNASRDGAGAVPSEASASSAPRWEKTSDEAVARWHDHRIHWMGDQPPPSVQAAPDRAQLISEWTIPMRAGSRPFTVAGTLSWVPAPSALPWVGLAAAAGLAALLVALLGPSPVPLAAVLILLLGIDVAHQVGIGFALAGSTGARLGATVSGTALAFWPLLVLAAVLLLRGRSRLGLGAALIGAALVAMFDGALEWSTLTSSQIPFAWSAASARALTALTLGIGTGAALAAAVRGQRLADDVDVGDAAESELAGAAEPSSS